jgi:hypothetical protein
MRDQRSSDSLDYLPTDGKTGVVGSFIKGMSAIISFALIAGIVIWSWRLGVRDASDLPVIRALEGPARTQPADPGGEEAAHQGLEVNGVLASNEEPPLSTETETAPGPTALTEEDAAEAVLNGGAGGTEGQAPAAGESVAALIEGLDAGGAVPGETAAPEAAPAPEEVDLTDLVPNTRPRARPGDLDTEIAPEEEVFAAATPEEMAPEALAPPGPEIRPGDRLVQLGAFDTAEIAEEQWQAVLADNGDLLGEKQHVIQEATSGGRIFFRLRVVGFADLEESRAMCSALQPREVPCIPVTAR